MVALYKIDPFRSIGVRIGFQQYYYMGVLSCLLIHYLLDGYFFTDSNRESARVEQTPYAAPAYSIQ